MDWKLDKREMVAELVEYAKVYQNSFDINIADKMLSNASNMSRMNYLIFVLDSTTLIPYVLYLLYLLKLKY